MVHPQGRHHLKVGPHLGQVILLHCGGDDHRRAVAGVGRLHAGVRDDGRLRE